MPKHLLTFFCLAALGLSIAGCTKCGWIWEQGAPKACHGDAPRG